MIVIKNLWSGLKMNKTINTLWLIVMCIMITVYKYVDILTPLGWFVMIATFGLLGWGWKKE